MINRNKFNRFEKIENRFEKTAGMNATFIEALTAFKTAKNENEAWSIFKKYNSNLFLELKYAQKAYRNLPKWIGRAINVWCLNVREIKDQIFNKCEL